MKVQLINVAEYEIKDGKASEIPFDTFVNLCGNVGDGTNSPVLPRVRLFKSLDEFKNLSVQEMETINQEEKVRVLPNGQFLIFLGETAGNKEKRVKSVKDNATADT